MGRLEFRNVIKVYERGSRPVRALDDVSVEVDAGEFVAVVGPSGAGKSTFLHLAGALDVPTEGSVHVDGQDLGALADEELSDFRRHHLGFIFQFFNLLPTLSAWENVALPRLLDGARLGAVREDAVGLLERVGLGERADHRPAQLSGGEMQRVAVARALVADPVLVLADEPTGNLDSQSGQQVLDLIRECAREEDRTLVMVTHNPGVAATADRVLAVTDGRIVADGAPSRVLDEPAPSLRRGDA